MTKRFLGQLAGAVLLGLAVCMVCVYADPPTPVPAPPPNRTTSDDGLSDKDKAAQLLRQQVFRRGLKPTPKPHIAALVESGKLKVFKPSGLTPTQVAYVAAKTSYWLNDQEGDCVSAEKAAAIGEWTTFCGSDYFIQDSTVSAFCNKYSICNGADLPSTDQAMQTDGMHQGGDTITMGPAASVDFSVESTLQNALAQGPVEIGMDAGALPSGAGNATGWYAFGGSPGQFSQEDHCINICGFGPAKFCFAALNTSVPSGAPSGDCYIIYTWNTFGVVDQKWIMSTVGEAYVRSPNVYVNGKAITPNPSPTPPPGPGPGPGPLPPGSLYSLTTDGSTGVITLTPASGPGAVVLTAAQVQQIQDILGGQNKAPSPAPPMPPPKDEGRSKPQTDSRGLRDYEWRWGQNVAMWRLWDLTLEESVGSYDPTTRVYLPLLDSGTRFERWGRPCLPPIDPPA